jgi:hypothetical protein
MSNAAIENRMAIGFGNYIMSMVCNVHRIQLHLWFAMYIAYKTIA